LRPDNIFSFAKVFVPINIHNMHWVLAVAFMQKKTIVYYDSLRDESKGKIYLKCMLRYLSDEAEDKQQYFNKVEWKLLIKKVPQQTNGNDCGVFACMFADLVLDDINVEHLQQGMMEDFRRKICYAILRRRIPYPL